MYHVFLYLASEDLQALEQANDYVGSEVGIYYLMGGKPEGGEERPSARGQPRGEPPEQPAEGGAQIMPVVLGLGPASSLGPARIQNYSCLRPSLLPSPKLATTKASDISKLCGSVYADCALGLGSTVLIHRA